MQFDENMDDMIMQPISGDNSGCHVLQPAVVRVQLAIHIWVHYNNLVSYASSIFWVQVRILEALQISHTGFESSIVTSWYRSWRYEDMYMRYVYLRVISIKMYFQIVIPNYISKGFRIHQVLFGSNYGSLRHSKFHIQVSKVQLLQTDTAHGDTTWSSPTQYR